MNGASTPGAAWTVTDLPRRPTRRQAATPATGARGYAATALVARCAIAARSGRRFAPVLVALATVLLAACGGDGEKRGKRRGDEPLVLKLAPATAGKPIDLDVPRDSEGSGAFAFDRWPRACGLLTDREIKAVLPQATRVRRKAEDKKLDIIEYPSEQEVEDYRRLGLPPPLPPSTPGLTPDEVAEGANCTYTLDLPAAGVSDAELSVEVDAAGTRAFVRENGPLFDKDTDVVEVPSGKCSTDGVNEVVSCRKGRLAFTIDSSYLDLGRYRRGVLNGKTTTFGDSEASVEREERFLRDALETELAKIVLAKI